MMALHHVAVLVFLLFQAVQAFLIATTTHGPKHDGVTARWMMAARRHDRPVVVVADNEDNGGAATAATLGAALALSVRDVLLEEGAARPVTLLLTRTDKGVSQQEWLQVLKDVCQEPPIVREQANPSIEDYEQVLQEYQDEKPILHVLWEEERAAPLLLESRIRNSISFLGIEPIVEKQNENGQMVVSREMAQHFSTILQQILDLDPNAAASVAMSVDWPLHLSLLQANCLPKSTAHGDSFLILPDNTMDSMVLVDYLYNPENRFGGMDPLSCPTTEVTIPTAATSNVHWTGTARHAAAAAYTACRGNGMDAVQAACIASNIGTIIASSGEPHLHPFKQPMMEQMAQVCRQFQENVRYEPVVRKRYIEFGYK